MRVRSGHIIFDKKVSYIDLLPIYRDFLTRFLKESNQLSNDEDMNKTIIESNMRDISLNRKPEGFNRPGSIRLMFPITEKGIECYIYKNTRSQEIVRITESLSQFLKEHKVGHRVEWDKMFHISNERYRVHNLPPINEI